MQWRSVGSIATVIDPHPSHRAPPIADIGIPYIGIRDIRSDGTINSATARIVDPAVATEHEQRYGPTTGDIVFCKVGTLGEARRIEVRERLALSATLLVIRARPAVVSQEFLVLALESKTTYRQIDEESRGSTREALGTETVRRLKVPVPPLNVQSKIVAALSAALVQLDQAVDRKVRLVALLEEKRQATVSQLVTKGLDNKVAMQTSGIPSVGRVPVHWKVQRNKTIFREVNDPSADGSEEMLTVSHITGVTKRSEKEVYMFEAETNEGYKRCQPGDLVINTMWAWMGAAGTAREAGLVSPAYGVYRPTATLVPEYYDALIRTPEYVAEMSRFSKGVWRSRLRLYPQEFLALRTLLPPPNEQQDIVRECNRQANRILALKAKLDNSIALLRERRQALITAAVTGDLDPSAYTSKQEVAVA